MVQFTRYLFRRGAAWLRHRLLSRATSRPAPDVVPYAPWIASRLQDRRAEYPVVHRPGLFSLLTPVFDPPAGFFRILGQSILAQDHRDFQWVVVDNGCTQPDVLYLLEKFARDPRVTLVRAGEPRGIIGGMRLALEQARGEYVCPVDHDDRLYPDALRVVAAGLAAHGWPRLAYTDEDKLLHDGSAGLPFFKPGWDPLLFLNCCYVAHLGVLHRETALALGVYTDPQAEGTPDGDAFCRFLAAGHVPVHLPEVVYSWRMHPQSTALLGIEAKPYVTASQKHVLSRHLGAVARFRTVQVQTNPLHGVPGTWRVAPTPGARHEKATVLLAPGGTRPGRRRLRDRLRLCPGVDRVVPLGRGRRAAALALASFADDAWVVLLDPHCLPLTTDFLCEFQAVREAVPEAAWIGGITLRRDGRVHSAGLVWGFGGVLGAPQRGTRPGRRGGPPMLFQRCVSAVEARFCFVQVGLLRAAVRAVGGDLTDPMLPAYLGARARHRGQRVVFTPYVTGQLHGSPRRLVPAAAEHRFLRRHGDLLAADPYYSRFFGLTRQHAYQAVRPAARQRVLQRLLCGLAETASYHAWCGDPHRYPLPVNETVQRDVPDEPPCSAAA